MLCRCHCLQLLLAIHCRSTLGRSCSSYEQVHSGCSPAPGPPTFCGTATKLYDGATVLANGSVVNGKRFHWEISQIARLPVTAGDPVVSCARACAQAAACVGFALEPSTAATTCFTVNSTVYTLTRLARTPSYGYTHDPTCRPTCGSGSDALRLTPGTGSLYQPRPAVSATAGGTVECAALCDRLPGCVGFSISNTTDALCFPTNSTSQSVTTYTPVVSYQRIGRHPLATVTRQHDRDDAPDGCLATLRHLCPLIFDPTLCHDCVGHNQREAHIAGCSAETVAKYCATSLDWWVAPPTDHIFEDDTPMMSQYCDGDPSSSGSKLEEARQSIQWSVIAGGTAAIQLAVRWQSTQLDGRARVTLHASDLTANALQTISSHRAPAIIPASSLSMRQLGSVFAQTVEYSSEKGAGFYPDILAPIYQAGERRDVINGSVFDKIYDGKLNETNGRRLAWDTGGRQLSNRRVPGGGGAAGVEQCKQICLQQVACRGFFLGTAGDCHTVNATNVAVATGLEGVSYRRKSIGMPLVPNLTRSVWIDVTVPAATVPGLYTGIVAVHQLVEKRGEGQEDSAFRRGQQPLFSVPISLRVWRINPDCLATQLGLYGKAYGFDPQAIRQLYPLSPTPAASATADENLMRRRVGDAQGNGSALPKAIQTFTQFMCERHVPAEALANSWATQRPLSDIELLLDNGGLDRCQQPLFNAAFLGITNPPQSPSPENITIGYVKKALDTIAPRMEQLKKAGLLSQGYIYAFDESKEDYADALRLLFGEVKRRWPEVSTLSVLNWPPTPDLTQYLDIWVTLYPNLDEPEFQSARTVFQNAGKQVWGYHCVAPSLPQYLNTFLDVPSAKSRLLPLVGALHNLTGWLFWYTNWGNRHAASATDSATGQMVALSELSIEGRSSYDPLVGPVDPQGRPLPDHSTNEDGNWVYAGLPDGTGGGEPLASQRLELWRLGMEDLALLQLLGPHEARELAQRLVRSGVDYTFNATLLEETRAEAIARLLAQQPQCAT